MINIVVGSESEHKLRAVKEACEKLSIDAKVWGVKTNSGQNEQPVGLDEIYGGARRRALYAYNNEHCETNADISIGIESGIIHGGGFRPTIDLAGIIVCGSDREIFVTSQGILFPGEFVSIASLRGFENTTVGSIISEKLVGDATDPHSILTNGKISRQQLLTEALVSALKQL